MFFKDFVSVKRKKIKKGASQTYDTPSCYKSQNKFITKRKYSTCTDGITQHALKGQKLLAQGNARGYYACKLVAL